jgi:hypothetical protein
MEQYYIPAIKVYDIDYDFIISNYLDVTLWNKIWTLFVYRDVTITICLYTIETKSSTITFELSLTSGNNRYVRTIKHNLRNSTVIILKNQINGAMESLISDLEYNAIKCTETYRSMQRVVSDERDSLEEIASRFLDANGVTNSEIRDVYIESYVYNNSQADSILSQFLYGKKYTELTDLFLIFADITKNENLTNNIKKANDSNKVQEILKELNEYKSYIQTEDFATQMQDNLNNI